MTFYHFMVTYYILINISLLSVVCQESGEEGDAWTYWMWHPPEIYHKSKSIVLQADSLPLHTNVFCWIKCELQISSFKMIVKSVCHHQNHYCLVQILPKFLKISLQALVIKLNDSMSIQTLQWHTSATLS